MEWVSAQLREDMVQMAVLQRTPTQRIFDLVSKRDSLGTSFTPEALVAMYDKKLKWSSAAEKLTVGYLARFNVFPLKKNMSPDDQSKFS